jgi:tetratricopeptide (TPR) repeat protein
MRAACAIGVIALAVACGDRPVTPDRRAAREVVLPDLSRVEASVQAQLRERHAALVAKQQDVGTPATDLGGEFGAVGMLLLAAGFHDPAEAALLNAQTFSPDDRRWPYYLGHLRRQKGDIPSAAEAFERALRLAPDDVPTMTWLAEAALDEGRVDAAEAYLQKALALEPDSVAVHYGLGRAALGAKDYDRAVLHLERALALDGKASVVHYPLAMAYRGLGDTRRAASHVQQRGALAPRPDPLLKALEDVLDSALTYERNADTAGNRGEWAEAVTYLRKAVALAPARPAARHKLGTALFYHGDRSGAFAEFQEAIRLSPGFAGAHYALGVLHEEDDDHPRAIASFLAALAVEPFHLDARLGLADALRRSGRFEQSLSEYEAVLAIDAGVRRARFGYAASLVRLKRFQQAAAWLTEAMALYPGERAFARMAARLFAAAPDRGVRDGRRALTIAEALLKEPGPPSLELAETLAMAAAEVGQYGDAVRWQRQALDAARAGRLDAVTRLSENLERYEARQPSRAPWREDERIEY